jgi:phosphatidate cytidylyltransferase
MADLNRRLIVSSISVVVVAFLITCSQNAIVRALLLLFVPALACIGVWEYAQLAIAKGVRPATRLMLIASAVVVIAFYASLHFVTTPQLPIFVLVVALLAFFINHFKEPQNSIVNIAVEFFGVAYVALPLSLMLGVLYPVAHEGAPQEGRWWLVYLIVVTKITDMGAYFVGRLWGKHMLSHLSPKKTVEGALSGFLCAVMASVGIHFLGKKFTPQDFHLSLFESIWLGALLGIAGQIGDLAESLLKRDASVKDSNHLPGLGGVLDMVDSLLITTPIVYFFINMH